MSRTITISFIAFFMELFTQMSRRIFLHATKELHTSTSNTIWRVKQTFSLWILANSKQKLLDRGFYALLVKLFIVILCCHGATYLSFLCKRSLSCGNNMASKNCRSYAAYTARNRSISAHQWRYLLCIDVANKFLSVFIPVNAHVNDGLSCSYAVSSNKVRTTCSYNYNVCLLKRGGKVFSLAVAHRYCSVSGA